MVLIETVRLKSWSCEILTLKVRLLSRKIPENFQTKFLHITSHAIVIEDPRKLTLEQEFWDTTNVFEKFH